MPGGVREIPLNRGRVALVDEADYEWLSQWRWTFAGEPTGGGYAVRGCDVGGARRTLLMHRAILSPEPGLQVDHINGDGLDNRRANLRPCTASQNCQNRAVKKGTRSGFKGVTKYNRYWRAAIRAEGRTRYIGYYATPEEAARAYDEAAMRLHGEFARLNFPHSRQREA